MSCVNTHSFSGACAQVWDWGHTAAARMTGHTHQQCQRVGLSPCQCHTCTVAAHCCGGGLCLVHTSWVISDTEHLLMACWPNPPGGEPPPCWAGVGGGVAQELKHCGVGEDC